eukprot:Gb_39478 [translate_table: standard]
MQSTNLNYNSFTQLWLLPNFHKNIALFNPGSKIITFNHRTKKQRQDCYEGHLGYWHKKKIIRLKLNWLEALAEELQNKSTR